MSRKSKSDKKKRFFGKKGYTITIVLAALILVVSIITLSYSWFSPMSQSGTSMSYSANIKVRSENCEIKGTYPATSENHLPMSAKTGNLESSYVSEPVESVTVKLIESAVDLDSGVELPADTNYDTANQIYYFRTKIDNNDVQPTNVSLYLKSVPTLVDESTPGETFSQFGIGVASPSNSYHTYTSQQSDVCIVRNAFIRGMNDEKYETLYVDWFVRITDTSVKIDFNNNLYLRYN